MTSLVSLDALTLGPVLAVAAGAALVLLLDVVAPRLRGAHFALGAASLTAGMALAVPGALGSESTPLRTLCLPAPVGACFYEAGPLASALQLGALGLGPRGAAARLAGRPCPHDAAQGWPGGARRPRAERHRGGGGGGRGPRPGVLAGRPRAGNPSRDRPRGPARNPVCGRWCAVTAHHLAGLLRDGGAGRGALARRQRHPGVLQRCGRARPQGRGHPRGPAAGGAPPRRRPGLQALARAVPRVDPTGVCRRHRARRGVPRGDVQDRGPGRTGRRPAPSQPDRCACPGGDRRAGRPLDDRGQRAGARAGRPGAPAGVVDGGAGRLGDPAPGDPVPGGSGRLGRLPARLRRRDPRRLHRRHHGHRGSSPSGPSGAGVPGTAPRAHARGIPGAAAHPAPARRRPRPGPGLASPDCRPAC